jgi:hypothetical protein
MRNNLMFGNEKFFCIESRKEHLMHKIYCGTMNGKYRVIQNSSTVLERDCWREHVEQKT